MLAQLDGVSDAGKADARDHGYLSVAEIMTYATGRVRLAGVAEPLVPTNVPTGLAAPDNRAPDLEPLTESNR